MLCPHLQKLEKAIIKAGIAETFRGQAWSKNCHEWVYFDCIFEDLPKTIQLFDIDQSVVSIHENQDPRSGQEYGLVCQEHNDAIMGVHPKNDHQKKHITFNE